MQGIGWSTTLHLWGLVVEILGRRKKTAKTPAQQRFKSHLTEGLFGARPCPGNGIGAGAPPPGRMWMCFQAAWQQSWVVATPEGATAGPAENGAGTWLLLFLVSSLDVVIPVTLPLVFSWAPGSDARTAPLDKLWVSSVGTRKAHDSITNVNH